MGYDRELRRTSLSKNKMKLVLCSGCVYSIGWVQLCMSLCTPVTWQHIQRCKVAIGINTHESILPLVHPHICISHIIMYNIQNTCQGSGNAVALFMLGMALTQTCTHARTHVRTHTRTHSKWAEEGKENQTYIKLSKQVQIPNERFGFGTRYSKFLEKLKWLMDISAHRQRSTIIK